MATVAMLVPTTNGDGVHPVDLWTSATPNTLRIAAILQHNLIFPSYDPVRGYIFVNNSPQQRPSGYAIG